MWKGTVRQDRQGHWYLRGRVQERDGGRADDTLVGAFRQERSKPADVDTVYVSGTHGAAFVPTAKLN